MKKLSLSLLAFVAALAVSSLAHADTTPGWYVGAGLGGSFASDPSLNQGGVKRDTTTDSLNLAEDASVGYAWNCGLRLEGELFHNQTNIKSVAGGFTNAGGHISNNIVFANVLHDIATFGRYTPYVGAGLGLDFAGVRSVGANGAGFLDGNSAVGAYQGIVGVAAQMDKNWAVTADYRYIASFDPKVDSSLGGSGRVENASHNILVGLRYSFDAPAPAVEHSTAPVVAAQGKSPVTADVVAQKYIVFFDFDKAVLTPEAKHNIALAAEEYKRSGLVHIVVTGHTDTVGTPAYNQKLSKRRAAAVKAELAKLGVQAKNIKAVGVGKNDLLVPTTDGVREAQNRRAELVLSK